MKNWVKNVQTAGYNGACTVHEFSEKVLHTFMQVKKFYKSMDPNPALYKDGYVIPKSQKTGKETICALCHKF